MCIFMAHLKSVHLFAVQMLIWRRPKLRRRSNKGIARQREIGVRGGGAGWVNESNPAIGQASKRRLTTPTPRLLYDSPVLSVTNAAIRAGLSARMNLPNLTGAQKTRLRGLGQTMPDTLHAGKQGLTPAFFVQLNRLLDARELIKLRFEGADRHERAVLIKQIEEQAPSLCVGAVGRTALFWRPGAEGSKLLVAAAE